MSELYQPKTPRSWLVIAALAYLLFAWSLAGFPGCASQPPQQVAPTETVGGYRDDFPVARPTVVPVTPEERNRLNRDPLVYNQYPVCSCTALFCDGDDDFVAWEIVGDELIETRRCNTCTCRRRTPPPFVGTFPVEPSFRRDAKDD